MKIRKSFVSNSSSSSFTCEITGETMSGIDMCLEDAGMCECKNGHIFLDNYLSVSIDIIEQECDQYDDWRYDVPAKYCPLCQKQYASTAELLSYALFVLKMDKDDLLEQYKKDTEYIPSFVKTNEPGCHEN